MLQSVPPTGTRESWGPWERGAPEPPTTRERSEASPQVTCCPTREVSAPLFSQHHCARQGGCAPHRMQKSYTACSAVAPNSQQGGWWAGRKEPTSVAMLVPRPCHGTGWLRHRAGGRAAAHPGLGFHRLQAASCPGDAIPSGLINK